MTQLVASAVYRRATDLLRERGWTYGEYEDGDGRLCIVGAINVAAGLKANAGSGGTDPVSDALTRPFDDKLGVLLAIWGDLFCTSREEAVELLEEMAELCAGEVVEVP